MHGQAGFRSAPTSQAIHGVGQSIQVQSPGEHYREGQQKRRGRRGPGTNG